MYKAFGCAYVVVALCAPVFAVPGKHIFALKRLPKVGDSVLYHVQAQFQFQGRSASMSVDQTETITKLESNGAFDVQTVANNGQFESDGKTRALVDDQPTNACYDPCGSLQSLDSSDDAYSQRKANMLAFISPDKQVAIGDKWQKEWKQDGNSAAAVSSFEVQGSEKVDGFASAKVSFSYTETSGDSPIQCSGYEWVSTADGSIVKIDVKFSNFPMGKAGAPVAGTLVMDRKS